MCIFKGYSCRHVFRGQQILAEVIIQTERSFIDVNKEFQTPTSLHEPSIIKALTALVGRLSLSVGWENGLERGLKAASFNP